MADYRDLLRRAIEALPENNGNARRQVYDKARAALRKQLDAIQPDLPSREKTHHRLQLEECIREVEQEATERILSGLSRLEQEDFDAPADEMPQTEPAPEPEDQAEIEPEPVEMPVADAPEGEDAFAPEPVYEEPESEDEDIAADEPVATVSDDEPVPADDVEEPETAEVVEPEIPDVSGNLDAPIDEPVLAEEETAPLEDDVPVPEEADAEPAPVVLADEPETESDAAELAEAEIPAVSHDTEEDEAQKDRAGVAPDVAEAGAALAAAAASSSEPTIRNSILSRFSGKSAATASVSTVEAAKAEPAMSSEVEVEVDSDPQEAIDHAIAVLDREASGGALGEATLETADPDMADLGFARAEAEDEGGGSPALTIFLVLVLLLLAGAGGASYWAWREGYLDLSNLFGSNAAATVSQTAATESTTPAATPPAEPVRQVGEATPAQPGTDTTEVSHPGNTAATPDVVETPATGLQQANEATAPTNTASDTPAATPAETGVATADSGVSTQPEDMVVTPPAAPATNTETTANTTTNVTEPPPGEVKTEDRLPVADANGAAAAAPAATDQGTTTAQAVEGSQSLLLEASDQANSGAVPFSGTVDWTRGVDELGQPTIQAKADIPARNMGVTLLIRKNSDPSLPASHLIEIDFTVSDSFIGGGIARVAGILMKNEELVQGVPLVGASARVVGNNFLFALSASTQDVSSNTDLIKSRKWMDLAIIYSTGKQAILTLEKDSAATKMFDEVMAIWNPASATAPAATDTTPAATDTTTNTAPAPTADPAPAESTPANP